MWKCSRADITSLGFAISLMTSASAALADCFCVFLLSHTPLISEIRDVHWSIWIKRAPRQLPRTSAYMAVRVADKAKRYFMIGLAVALSTAGEWQSVLGVRPTAAFCSASRFNALRS
jgi:hypothetical protein